MTIPEPAFWLWVVVTSCLVSYLIARELEDEIKRWFKEQPEGEGNEP